MKTLLIFATLLIAAQARAESCHDVCMSGFENLGDGSYNAEYDRWVPSVFPLTDEQIVHGEDQLHGADTRATLGRMAARDNLSAESLRLIARKCAKEFTLSGKNPSVAALVTVAWIAKTKTDFAARLQACR